MPDMLKETIVPPRDLPARILVVEDEPISAQVLERTIRKIGHEILGIAPNGSTAIDLALRERPDLILMDIVLDGDMDGIEAAAAIRDRAEPAIPVVFLTAHSDDETFARARTADPYGFIIKPFQERELFTTIELALYRSMLEQREWQSQRWLSTTLSSLSEAVVTCDDVGKVIYANPIAAKMLGLSRDQIAGRHFNEVVQIEGALTWDSMDQGSEQKAKLRIADGSTIDVEISMSTIEASTRGVDGAVIVMRDITARLRNEERLRLLASAVEFAQDSILITTADLSDPQIVFVNPGFTRITGYTFEDVQGQTPKLLQGPRTSRAVIDILRQRLAAGKNFAGEAINYRKDGSEFYNDWSVTPLPNEAGEVTHFLAIQRDVSERRRDQERLARRYIYEAGVSSFSRTLLSASESGKILERAFLQLIVFYDVRRVLLLRYEPERHRYAVHTDAVRDAAGEADIEKEVQLDRVLSAHEWLASDRQIATGRTHSDGVEDGILNATRARSCLVFPVQVHQEYYGALCFLDYETERSWADEDINILSPVKDLTALHIERQQNLTELRRHRDELQRLVDDRTEDLRRARDEAVTANRVKSEFLANMSHELRTPLNSIIGFSRLIKLPSGDESQAELLQYIHSAGKHLLKIINDILDISKMEAGKMQMSMVATDLMTIIQQSVSMVRPNADERDITISIAGPDEGVAIKADENRLKQVMLNLLSNAIKFNRTGGRVDIEVEKKPGIVVCLVRDTGQGVPRDMREAIFDNFTQATTGLATEHEGTGLGLAITRRIVDLHFGRIQVTSNPPGGSVFILELPRLPDDEIIAGAPETDRPYPVHLREHEIVIVDDNSSNLRMLEIFFQQNDQPHRVFSSSPECLDYVRNQPVRIVLTDVRMPVLDGIGLLRAIRETSSTCVIAMTAFANAMEDTRQRYLDLGFDGFVSKPIDTARLVDILEGLSLQDAAGS